jgi:hypothetical protein
MHIWRFVAAVALTMGICLANSLLGGAVFAKPRPPSSRSMPAAASPGTLPSPAVDSRTLAGDTTGRPASLTLSLYFACQSAN